MSTTINQTYYMTLRHLRALIRQPAFVLITLVQPIIWLGLFGGLFKSVVDIPGFATASYITFLTPGIVIMTALFSNGWSGMASSRTSTEACSTASWSRLRGGPG
jgi:ABC-2 type transport system permease protein